MHSVKVLGTDPLYVQLNNYLVHQGTRSVVVCSRPDYKDPGSLKLSLDFGSYDMEIGPDKTAVHVEHIAPTERREAAIVLTSASFASNMHVIDCCLRCVVRSESDRHLVGVFSWDTSKWQQRQAVHVQRHSPTLSQQAVLNDVARFYKSGAFYQDRGLPYKRGILLAGDTCTGKHWLVRHMALQHGKTVCYFPVMETSYAAVGPAMACAPLNSIVVLDNLAMFFAHIPNGEQGLFLRHLETVFNTPLQDPAGLVVVALAPQHSPAELDRFLLMPHRFQKRFELCLSDRGSLFQLLKSRTQEMAQFDHAEPPSVDALSRLARLGEKAGVSVVVLEWFFAMQAQDAAPALDLAMEVEEEDGQPNKPAAAAKPTPARRPEAASKEPVAATGGSEPRKGSGDGESLVAPSPQGPSPSQTPRGSGALEGSGTGDARAASPASPCQVLLARLERLIQSVREERSQIDQPLQPHRQRLYS